MALKQKTCALIGLDRAGESFLELLAGRPELELCAVIEPDPVRRRAAARRGLRTGESVDPLLLPGQVPELAIVCAPPGLHTAILEPLLHAGVDCLVEGPLAAAGHEADRLAEKAERLGRALVTATGFRFSPAVIEARRRIARGAIGSLCQLELELGHKLELGGDWRADPVLSGGVWAVLGAHALDLAEALAGPTDRIRMRERQRRQGTGVDDEVTVETLHDSGIRSRISLSWNREPAAPLACCVGNEGDLRIGAAQTRLRTAAGDRAIGPGYDASAALVGTLAEFLRARLRPDGFDDDGPLLTHWLDAGARSLHSARWEIT